eukprot:TRINITY_DN73783_c0_g1_i1.p1 TRINITY_DN73783_c0_g1~~TRINITY_DN73783_c0_g1_i1.p1  ORF type:complete len:116 (-),score=16.98 TRINITY_DN73783_c0_g1_i1:64-411(-)
MGAAARAGDLVMTLAFLQEVKDSGIVKPNVVLYGAALDACKTVADAQTAWHLLDEMRSQGIETNIVVFTTAVAAYASCPLACIQDLVAEMEAEGIRENAYFVESYIMTLYTWKAI